MSDCTGPSYKGNDLVEVFKQALVRCGKPATRETGFGPRCESCFADLERAANDPRTILGMAREIRKSKN